MQNFFKKLLTMLAPVLGAGVIGVCPLCWIGSASLLTYLGLGALIPAWRWIAFGFVALGAVGFLLDYRAHKNPKPLVLLTIGTVLLYVEPLGDLSLAFPASQQFPNLLVSLRFF